MSILKPSSSSVTLKWTTDSFKHATFSHVNIFLKQKTQLSPRLNSFPFMDSFMISRFTVWDPFFFRKCSKPRMQPHLNMDVFAFKHLANNFGVAPRQLRVQVVELTSKGWAWDVADRKCWINGDRINGLVISPTYKCGILVGVITHWS